MSYKHTHTSTQAASHSFLPDMKEPSCTRNCNLHKKPHPSPDSPQCSLGQKGQKPFSNKIRDLSWLSWCTELGPDSCFIHFCVKMFLSASCVVYWSAVHDRGRTKMKTSQDDFPFLLKDLNTIRAVWSSFFSGYCSPDWQNPWDNEKLSQAIFPAVLYSGKAGPAPHTAKLATRLGRQRSAFPISCWVHPKFCRGKADNED